MSFNVCVFTLCAQVHIYIAVYKVNTIILFFVSSIDFVVHISMLRSNLMKKKNITQFGFADKMMMMMIARRIEKNHNTYPICIKSCALFCWSLNEKNIINFFFYFFIFFFYHKSTEVIFFSVLIYDFSIRILE
jgi:hypothetical protein